MKKFASLCTAFLLLSTLAACGHTPASSASSGSASGASPSASSSAKPAVPDSGSASASASSAPAAPDESAETPALPALENPAMHFITLPAENPDGSQIEKGLLVAKTPQDWEYDNYTTFFKNEKKVAEVLHLWPAAEGDSPFADFMTEPYTDNGMFPEGFGLASSQDLALNGSPVHILHMKTWSDDADAPSYPLFVFYNIEGYVIEVHFYPEAENDEAEQQLFLSVLSTFDLHFSRDNVSESGASDASQSTSDASQDNA